MKKIFVFLLLLFSFASVGHTQTLRQMSNIMFWVEAPEELPYISASIEVKDDPKTELMLSGYLAFDSINNVFYVFFKRGNDVYLLQMNIVSQEHFDNNLKFVAGKIYDFSIKGRLSRLFSRDLIKGTDVPVAEEEDLYKPERIFVISSDGLIINGRVGPNGVLDLSYYGLPCTEIVKHFSLNTICDD